MCKNSKISLRTVNNSDALVLKTGLGCGVDITGVLGTNESVKTQILDYPLLVSNSLVEIDDSEMYYDIERSGKNYSEMTSAINNCLAGKISLGVKGLSFGCSLNRSFSKTSKQIDIYEYAEKMVIRKMYALNIKPHIQNSLRNYIMVDVWNEINATNSGNRTDISAIMELYQKFGTHLTTKTFYGCMYEYIMRREQNEWETSIEKLLKMDTSVKAPCPDGITTIDASKELSVSDKDRECRNNSNVETVEHRYGGDTSVSDVNSWMNSCVKGEKNNCALLGYSLGVDSATDSGLIPLYDLLDSADPRRQAMIDALQEYINMYGQKVEQRNMVIVDAIVVHIKSGDAHDFMYAEDINGIRRKFFRLDENIYKHVKGSTKGKMYFYYALGHLTDNAVVDMKFCSEKSKDGDWKLRGCNSNEGVVGCLKDRYLAIKLRNVANYPDPSMYVTGFGVKVNAKVKAISKGTEVGFNWISNKNGENWYSSGLLHDDVACIFTKDKLHNF